MKKCRVGVHASTGVDVDVGTAAMRDERVVDGGGGGVD